jgi:cell shape-determining protein MreC
VINNKKVFLIYIVCFFLFLTLLLFPNYNSKTKLFTYFLKDKVESPFIFVGNEVRDLFLVFNLNFDYADTIKKLEDENNYLQSINKYLLTLTSKYSDQNKIFHQSSVKLPISVGVHILGDRNLVYNKNFIINKGSNNGLVIGDYIIDGLNIVGRIVSINFNTSEVVTVKSINYGDEVFINGKSYIVSGTNNNYLSFLRQKESTEIPDFQAGDIAVVHLNDIKLRLFITILFLIYGNFSSVINDIVIFSLINIAFYTVLKEKNIKIIDVLIFILSTFVVEVFVGLPILIGIVILFIPLILLNYFINNYNFALFIKSSIIFLLSFIAFCIFDQTLVFRLLNLQYFITIFILILIFLGLSKYGKE